MRFWAPASLAILCGSLSYLNAASKLTWEDRVEITRGLTAEYATAKESLPRSKKALEFNTDGKYDKAKWADARKENGPAARVGDLVQVTKVTIEGDRLILEINGGMKGKRHWYDGVQIGMGGNTSPISQGDSNAVSGTTLALVFGKAVEPIKASEVKKLLAPILDFEKRSATELYTETLSPEMQKAIKEKRVTVGMDRDQVVLALGKPDHKSREVKDGMELEDWVFGKPPGKITFVTFNGSKVSKVKESFAGLGSEAAPLPVPQ